MKDAIGGYGNRDTNLIRDIGERRAIKMIESIIGSKNIGDDCAVVDFGGYSLLVSTDMVTAKKHMPEGMTPYDLGYFLAAVNLSDLAAMGGKPLGLVTALGIPRYYKISDFKSLVRGIHQCARKHGTNIIGGDTKECSTISLSGTVIGYARKNRVLKRSGAKPGDIVMVTGKLGGAASAYFKITNHEKLSTTLKHRLIRPEPRLREGIALSSTGAVTSCMDISDGLASSLYQMAEASGVGFELDAERIPAEKVAKHVSRGFGVPIEDLLFHFGGEYELVFTVKKDAVGMVKKAIRACGTSVPVAEIGRVLEADDADLMRVFVRHPAGTYVMDCRGWEHFRS